MITPDTQILSVVQIALIGILVVIGMFLLWRKIQRVEQKLESWIMASSEHGFCQTGGMPSSFEPKQTMSITATEKPQATIKTAEEEMQEDMELMKTIFDEEGIPDTSAAFMVFSPFGYNVSSQPPINTETKSVKIEEIPMQEKVHKKEEDSTSDTPTDKGHLTKTQVLRMNVDSLKDVLSQHGLSTEGTRKQLIDRIYENNVVH